MFIAHLNLAPHMNGAEERLVLLVEALAAHGIRQHAIVRNAALASRLAASNKLSIGPLVRSPATAYCLMPSVDLVHVHDRKGMQTGLLLTLTRSIPYVATYRARSVPGSGPITRSMFQRAETLVCDDRCLSNALQAYAADTPVECFADATETNDSGNRMSPAGLAAEYMRIYRRALDRAAVPAMLL